MTPRLPHGTRPLMRIGSIRRDMDDELAFHFEQTVADLVREGYSMSDARDEAARRFGDEQQYRRDLESIDRGTARVRRWTDLVDGVRQMVTQSMKSVVRAPGLTAGIVAAFALGIGANATMLGIIDRLLLRPPEHISDPDRVRHLFFERHDPVSGTVTDPTISYPDYIDLTRVTAFSDIAAGAGRQLTVGTGPDAHEVRGEMVTGNYFRTLGVKPVLGRFFDPDADRIGGAPEVVISYAMWQREYAGARDVTGRTLDYGYGAYTIVGVAPKGFTGNELTRVDMWLPLRQAAAQLLGTGWESEADGARGWQWLETLARLKPGVTAAQAEASATAAHRAGRAADIARGDWGRDPRVIAGSIIQAKAPNAPGSAAVATLLAGVSVLVLLIACVNVANLLLARTIRQRREIAVRLALGISRRRLIGQVILDGLVLAFLGGAAALLVERWGGGIVRHTLLPDVAWDETSGSHFVIITIIALSVVAGIVSALMPALQVARRDVAAAIRAATAGGISRGTSRLRSALALAQTALSVILLIGAGLFVRSLHNVRSLDLGFDVNHLLFAEVKTAKQALDQTERQAVFARGIDEIARIPGVRAIAVSSTMPFRAGRTTGLRAQDVDSARLAALGEPYIHGVTPGYFSAMGIQLQRGRGFEQTDVDGHPPVAIVGQRMAATLWPSENPLGKCLFIGSDAARPCTTIVGIAENASNNDLRETEMLQYYVPLAQHPDDNTGRPAFWFIRTTGEDASLITAIRRQIMSLDSRIRFAPVLSFQDRIDPKTSQWKLGATMFGVFGILALLVAAIGLYSVLAFDIAQRTRELGLRTALGASAATLIRAVVTRALGIAGAGLMIGGATALVLAPRVSDMLFETKPRDPVTFLIVAVTPLVVTVLAATVPAWRATRVDPNIALRAE